MVNDWIFDVLVDLRSFALANGLPALAAQIDTAMQVAEVEMTARAEGFGHPPIPQTRAPRAN